MRNMIILFTIAVLVSCNEPTAPPINNPNGTFNGRLVLYDSTGNNPVYGTITLNRSSTNYISGNWKLGNENNGKLSGSISNDSLSINLNPDMIDNNTILFGTTDGKTIKGRWYHSSYVGITNKGTFMAYNNFHPL